MNKRKSARNIQVKNIVTSIVWLLMFNGLLEKRKFIKITQGDQPMLVGGLDDLKMMQDYSFRNSKTKD